MAPASIDVRQVMAALSRLEGRGEETLRRLVTIEGGLVAEVKVATIDMRVKRLDGHVVWGVRGVIAAAAASVRAALHWRG